MHYQNAEIRMVDSNETVKKAEKYKVFSRKAGTVHRSFHV